MKFFLKRFFLFTLIFSLLFLIFEKISRHIYEPFQVVPIKISQFLPSSKTIELIVIGSSHAHNGINAGSFPIPSFNWGIGGQDLYYGTHIINDFALPRSPRLKIIMLVLDYFSWNYSLLESDSASQLAAQYDRYMGISPPNFIFPTVSPVIFPGELRINYIKGKFQFYVNRTELFRDLVLGVYSENHISTQKNIDPENLKTNNLMLADGTLLKIGTMTPIQMKIHATNVSKRESQFDATQMIPTNSSLLQNFLSTMHEKSIQTILIIPPYSDEYKKSYPAEQKIIFSKNIREIAKNNSLQLWDYSSDPAFLDQFFYDSDHLNAHGAIIFSNKLGNHLKSYLSESNSLQK